MNAKEAQVVTARVLQHSGSSVARLEYRSAPVAEVDTAWAGPSSIPLCMTSPKSRLAGVIEVTMHVRCFVGDGVKQKYGTISLLNRASPDLHLAVERFECR
jgi:hypothetical protein